MGRRGARVDGRTKLTPRTRSRTPTPRTPTPRASRRRPDVTAPDEPPEEGQRRPPPARVSPEALAAARGGAGEGRAWLGRAPEADASVLYRLLRLVARFVVFVVFRFRIRATGRE